tara:strand:- start:332 stop:595 length:264 start_codon:yes stop_codon:yes gene_type:complete
MTTIESLIPEDAQYKFDASTGLATVQIETKASRPGKPVYADITAKVKAMDYDGETMIEAEYVSHEGEATQDDIDYALRVIETNDFGV